MSYTLSIKLAIPPSRHHHLTDELVQPREPCVVAHHGRDVVARHVELQARLDVPRVGEHEARGREAARGVLERAVGGRRLVDQRADVVLDARDDRLVWWRLLLDGRRVDE